MKTASPILILPTIKNGLGWPNPYLAIRPLSQLFGGEFCLGDVATPWILAGLPKKGLSPTIEGMPHTQTPVMSMKFLFSIYLDICEISWSNWELI